MDIIGFGDRSGQELLQPGGFGHVWPGCFEASDAAQFGGEFHQRSWSQHRGDGSMLRRAPSGSRVRCPRALSASDVTGVCAPLCEGPKERRTGCGGDCRSGDTADDAFVTVKSQYQSDVQALHRARERLVSERTALINHLRALLLERGIVAPQGRRKLQEELAVFADEDGIEALSPRIRLLIEDLRSEWCALDERIAAFDAEFVRMAREDEAVRRLTQIPGIGKINATALAAAVGNARAFRRGRDMAAWLGLTPPPMTNGGEAAPARRRKRR